MAMMRSPAFPPRRPSHFLRYIIPVAVFVYFLYYFSRTSPASSPVRVPPTTHVSTDHGAAIKPPQQGSSTDKKPEDVKYPPVEKPIHDSPAADDSDSTGAHAPPSTSAKHPIDTLIKTAEQDFDSILAKEARTLGEAADTYRKRRGRHPPPGFDAWYEFARDKHAVMVEDFFDQIYHDLNPFWGMDPKRIRKEACDYEMTINIRNGNASAQSDWFWTQIWLNMTKTIEHLLPDMDIALNAMDEPRMVVPWEDIQGYMKKEKQTLQLVPVKKVVTEFQKLPPPKQMDKLPHTLDKNWEDTSPYWDIARRGCPPDSPARKAALLKTYDTTPAFEPSWATPHQYEGYVANFSLSKEFCHQPDLQGLEGIFIRPLSTSATKVLFPMFGGSKLATNNEILLPAPMYWNEEERFTGGDDHGGPWNQKGDAVIWRGVATGGKNTATNWKGFQRHRFVSMSNGTKLARAENAIEPPVNFELPSTGYNLAAQKEGRLGEWVSQWSDVGFTELMCDDSIDIEQEWGHCIYTDHEYELVLGQKMSVQFNYKYLPDIDGNSFSGRYLGFLRSTSLPIKSTLWREWHDSRLVPWKHFVPMDNRFGDFYGIMEYFLGYGDTVPGHDAEARKIAMDGKAWAEKVLRKEDMQIYALRLFLEYARITNDQRDQMGWVDDLR